MRTEDATRPPGESVGSCWAASLSRAAAGQTPCAPRKAAELETPTTASVARARANGAGVCRPDARVGRSRGRVRDERASAPTTRGTHACPRCCSRDGQTSEGPRRRCRLWDRRMDPVPSNNDIDRSSTERTKYREPRRRSHGRRTRKVRMLSDSIYASSRDRQLCSDRGRDSRDPTGRGQSAQAALTVCVSLCEPWTSGQVSKRIRKPGWLGRFGVPLLVLAHDS